MIMRSPLLVLSVACLIIIGLGCSDDASPGKACPELGPCDASLPDSASGDLGDGQVITPDGPSGDGLAADGAPAKDSFQGDSAPPPAQTCKAPIALADISKPDTVVGTGSAASCTTAALQAAVTKGGVVTFDCGAKATIAITKTVEVPTDRDTVIDGEGAITLDGQGKVRLFRFFHGDYRKNTKKLVLQRLRLINAKASGTDFTPEDKANPDCAYGYKDGGGGVIRVRDGVLHVIDCSFENNERRFARPRRRRRRDLRARLARRDRRRQHLHQQPRAPTAAPWACCRPPAPSSTRASKRTAPPATGQTTSSKAAPAWATPTRAAPAATAGRSRSTAPTTSSSTSAA
jgi:hypothetical protein